MKKQTITVATIGMALASSLCAQSLFDLAPDDTQSDSLPLTWTAGLNFGLDDNPTPLGQGGEDDAFYGNAYLGVTFLNNSPQTTLNFGAQIGVIHYFDNIDIVGQDIDDTYFTTSLYLNWTHRVSERLRFVSRNLLSYELEPDYSVGFQAQRQNGNYFRWSTDNAVGYRWSDRLATYTGIRFDGITFEDFDGGDRTTITAYNDFRYQVSDRTVATLTYRYSDVDGEDQVSDSTNHFILAGIEHRFSQQTTGVLRAGVQIRDVDQGDSGESPYVEGSFTTRVNESFSLRGYARYGVEDFQRSLVDFSLPFPPTAVYSNVDALRLGLTANYQISSTLGLNGGVNFAMLDYNERQSIRGQSQVDEDFLNLFVGFDYQVTDNVSLNARYNFEDLSSDADRDYDRNRFSLGASTTF